MNWKTYAVVTSAVVIVGLARVRFNNHWPSDIFVGAALGVLMGNLVIGRLLATRLLDFLWRTFVDHEASPAAPEVAAAIRDRRTADPAG